MAKLKGRNTMVLFMSNNGYAWGDHGLQTKSSPYREAVEIPLMMKWTGRIDRGSVDRRMVANIDIAPTIVDATGISTEDGPVMDGRSLLDPTWDRSRLLLEYTKNRKFPAPSWASTITRESQYIELLNRRGLIDREYYDLVNDPYQLTNLLGDERSSNDPLGVPAMSLLLDQDRRCEGPMPLGTCP